MLIRCLLRFALQTRAAPDSAFGKRAADNKLLSQGRALTAFKTCPCIGFSHTFEYKDINPPQRQ